MQCHQVAVPILPRRSDHPFGDIPFSPWRSSSFGIYLTVAGSDVISWQMMKTHVRVIPAIFAEMKRRHVFLAYRDLLILQALDERDEGQIRYQDAVDGIVAMGKHPKTAQRMIKRAIDAGMVRAVYVAHLDVTFLKFLGRPKLLERFGCEKVTQVVEVPVELLLAPAWYRHLEGAAIAALARPRDAVPRPIARATRKRLHGSSPQTQRRADKVAKVVTRRCWVAKPADGSSEPGTKTMDGVTYTRIGNSYQQSSESPYRVVETRIYASRASDRRSVGRAHSWRPHREHRSAHQVFPAQLLPRVMETYDAAVRIRPHQRSWGWPAHLPIRGGRDRLYVTHETPQAVIYSSVATRKQDWIQTTGFVPPKKQHHTPPSTPTTPPRTPSREDQVLILMREALQQRANPNPLALTDEFCQSCAGRCTIVGLCTVDDRMTPCPYADQPRSDWD